MRRGRFGEIQVRFGEIALLVNLLKVLVVAASLPAVDAVHEHARVWEEPVGVPRGVEWRSAEAGVDLSDA